MVYHDSKTDGTLMAKWMVFPKLMGSLGKMDGFKSAPQTHEKWWENDDFQVAQQVMKNGGKMDGFTMIQKLMEPPWQNGWFSKTDGLPWQHGWFQKWSTDT